MTDDSEQTSNLSQGNPSFAPGSDSDKLMDTDIEYTCSVCDQALERMRAEIENEQSRIDQIHDSFSSSVSYRIGKHLWPFSR